MLNEHDKLLISARFWLLGLAVHDPEYFQVVSLMEKSLLHHNGLRNGGDPEFIHQLGIFHYIRKMHKQLKNPKMVYMLVFGHDMIEDPNQHTGRFVSPEEIRQEFGEEYTIKLLKMSKEILGQKNPNYSLQTIFEDEDCGPAKGADRVDNVSTMYGVFKEARLERYIKETAEQFIPLLKMARRLHPHQEPVYEALKESLNTHLDYLIKLSAKSKEAPLND